MDLVTLALGITTRESLVDKLGKQRRQAGNHYWDTLGRQREAMVLVTFGLRIMDLVIFRLGITTGTRLGGNGNPWIW